MTAPFKCGFATVVGQPNAGKSTLVNRLVGQKVAIVTSRPQTTRNRIQGIVNRPNAQVILIDTPGLHRADSVLGRQMMGEVDAAVEGVDVLALLIDASERSGRGDQETIERFARFEGPRVLLLNKIDRVRKAQLLPRIDQLAKAGDFGEVIPISALTGDGVDLVVERLIAYLPAGEPCFPPDLYTDQPERFLVAEMIREKAMATTAEEVPHAVAVLVDTFEETERLIRVEATLYVERQGQKGIVIGHQGERLKQIGTAARRELEDILGTKMFLQLYVKVQRNWRDNPELVRQLDWRRQIEDLARR